MPACCARAFAKFCLICPGKGGIILKAAAVADLCDRQLRDQQLPGGEKPFAGDVAADGISRLLLKEPHQMIAAKMKPVCDPVNVQILCEILVDIVEHRQDSLICREGVAIVQLLIQSGTV